MHGNFHVQKAGYHSLERTGDAGRFGSKVILCEWVEKIAVGHAPAAQLKTEISLFLFAAVEEGVANDKSYPYRSHRCR
jgi:hypothetical protein